jgi:hypothetical protein
MLKPYLHRSVRKLENRYSYDASYLHELIEISKAAFFRFSIMQSLGGTWRGGAPRDAWCAAGIAGALVEDCGPCVQIATDIALDIGVRAEVIGALLAGRPTDKDAQLGFDYGRALLLATEDLDRLRDEIERQWGKRALLAISYRAMSARNFPVLKRALGHAKTCQKVRIENADILVKRSPKAA